MSQPDPPEKLPRRLFQIGPGPVDDGPLTQMLRSNGLRCAHWFGGALAEDIAYARLTGGRPLNRWPAITAFSGLESLHRPGLPMIRAWRDFAFLDTSFPGAVFVFCLPDEDLWIEARLRHQDGGFAYRQACQLGVPQQALPNLWRAERCDHLAACHAYFGKREDFILWNPNQDRLAVLRRRLSRWFDLPILPEPVSQPPLCDAPPATPPLITAPAHPCTEAALQRLIADASPDRLNLDPVRGYDACSAPLFARLVLPQGKMLKRDGQPMPVCRDADGSFIGQPGIGKLGRVCGVAADLARLSGRGEFVMDMQDGRRFGISADSRVGGPVITYCRREGAENLFLWPLPGYHSIGGDFFPGGPLRDPIPFEDKRDKAVWRGALSGHCSDVVDGVFDIPVHQLVAKVNKMPADRLDVSAMLNQLRRNIRFGLTEAWRHDPDLDIALTARDADQNALTRLGRAELLDGRRPPQFFWRFRYILSLRGYDTGSNFLFAAASNALVLREEDGWQLFYSGLFQPWQHYVPLAPGAADWREKLDWARANPGECKEMIHRAHKICDVLADAGIRDRHLRGVARAYLRATGQECAH